jgi:selenophosphate synthetase-related protein
LSVRPENVEAVQALFQAQNLVCAVVGEVQVGTEVILRSQGESTLFWDFSQQSLTGFNDQSIANLPKQVSNN